jgi:hypothetical protein
MVSIKDFPRRLRVNTAKKRRPNFQQNRLFTGSDSAGRTLNFA